MSKSKFFTLNWGDLKKSLQIVVISTAIPAVVVILNEGRFPVLDDIKTIGLISLGAWISYLTKNLLTNSQDEFLSDEPK
jgi:hypothetical protein